MTVLSPAAKYRLLHFHFVNLKRSAKMELVFRASHLFIHSFILLSVVFIQGLKIATKPQQVNVAVKVGHDACLQCPLSYSTDVLQVMWQKILPEEEVTVATCHRHRHKLNPDFSSKIGLREATLRNCSIVVQNVTEQDEGCYLCLFITSSDVADTAKACVHMYELHEPILNISRSTSKGELEVSCSATGRPTPAVTLHVRQTIWNHTNTVINSNGTVTVIRTAALSHLHLSKTLECSVTSPFGSEQKWITIPDDQHPDGFGLGFSPIEDNSTLALWIGLGLWLFCGCAAVSVVWLFITKQHNARDDVEDNLNNNKVMEGVKTPLKVCEGRR